MRVLYALRRAFIFVAAPDLAASTRYVEAVVVRAAFTCKHANQLLGPRRFTHVKCEAIPTCEAASLSNELRNL